MDEKFFNKKDVDSFRDFEYPFGTVFLKELFEGYKRKYSMIGDGIYDLILIDNKIYDVRFKETKTMMQNDGKKALRDTTKDYIVETIVQALESRNIPYSVNSGKFITFVLQNKYIAKVEIVKKAAMPQ